jgi:hypothetical protein
MDERLFYYNIQCQWNQRHFFVKSQLTIVIQSPSSCSKLLEHLLRILKKGHPVLANDQVIIIRVTKDKIHTCTNTFSHNITLNSIAISQVI